MFQIVTAGELAALQDGIGTEGSLGVVYQLRDTGQLFAFNPTARRMESVGQLRLSGTREVILAENGGALALTEQAPIVTLTDTGTALTGAGEYGGFVVRAISGTPQTVTVYDATTATGTPIHTETVTATGSFPWSGNRLRPLAAGCRVVISGGTSRTLDVLAG